MMSSNVAISNADGKRKRKFAESMGTSSQDSKASDGEETDGWSRELQRAYRCAATPGFNVDRLEKLLKQADILHDPKRQIFRFHPSI